jgi:rod shape-determining protein MreD
VHSLAILLSAFVFLVLQSTLAHLLPWDQVVPNAALVIALHMGIHDYSTGKGAILAFLIGYFMDAFAGSPIGLYTFVSVAIFLISRIASLRLFLQGWAFEIFITFFLALVAGVLTLSIRALFDQDFGSLLLHAKIVIFRAVATAIVAPLVYKLMKKIDLVHAKRASRARMMM